MVDQTIASTVDCTQRRTMSAVVTKSSPVIVRPSSEPVTTTTTSRSSSSTTTTIKLTSFDKAVENLPVTVLLVFEHPIHDTTESIKSALSRALVHYSPFAGRIVGDDHHIRCSGEGVVFVAATASCGVEEVIAAPDHSPATRSLRDELAVRFPHPRCGAGEPLLMVQVTEFSCGGFVLGVTWNHAVADGLGLSQFLRAVGELARGLPSPSVAPVRCEFDGDGGSLPTSLLPAAADALPLQRLKNMAPLAGLVHLGFTVPWSSVRRIRAEFRRRFTVAGVHQPPPCTVFEAVCAVVWLCRTRAAMSDPEAPAMLFFSADARGRVGAKRGYYGNCVTAEMVAEKSGAVAAGDVVDLAKKISDAKKKKMSGGGQMRVRVQDERYNMLIVSSWINIGIDKVDLGCGTPARIAPPRIEKVHFPAFGVLPPCKGRDGANVSSVVVKEEHAEAFLQELARLDCLIDSNRSKL